MTRRAAARGLAVVALALFACRRERDVFPNAPIVLISIDTLRADRLPAYGYRQVETPALDALAADGIVFENATAHVPLTLPSHASLLTGLLPFQHGVRDNLGYRLGKDRPTLAALLKARGYATGGAVSAIVLERATGIAQGFDFFDDAIESRGSGEAVGQVQRPGGETEGLLERWLEEQAEGKPVFAFLHVYEPHTPYAPPEPFRTRYAARPYDGEVAAADAIVGRFAAFLKARRIYDRALVLLVSDHGEGLGDHGEDEHGIFLYRESIRVPLIVKLPGSRSGGTHIARPVGLVDVVPTALAATGAVLPAGLPGVSLLADGDAGRRLYSETLYPRFHFGWSDLASLNDGRFHYVEAPRPELYDWETDPGEKTNRVSERPPALRAMRAELLGMNRPLQAPGPSDPETVKKLAALGYIGVTKAGVTEKNLPDPKDGIASVRHLKEASRLVAEGRYDRAVALLESLTRESPRMLDAWETLARTYRKAGRLDEAFEALSRADRLQPGTPQILLGLSELALQRGDTARAGTFANAAAAAGSSGAGEVLGTVALSRGDLAQARRQAQAEIEKSPRLRSPLLLLARIEREAGNLDAARDALERLGRLERESGAGPLADYQYLKGDVLARLGRETAAEEAFRAEMKTFPENPRGWTGLALLYASQGKDGEAHKLLADLVAKSPTPEAYFSAARTFGVLGDTRSASRLRVEAHRLFPGAREPRSAK